MKFGSVRIPLWLKLLYTLFVGAAVWVYENFYGPANFLWFSDIALIMTAGALWMESSFLASMMAVAILLPESVWTVAFFGRLLTGLRMGGVTGYMFDHGIPVGIRAISLFHLFLPVLLVWMIYRLGYDRRALVAQTVFGWVVFIATFAVTNPQKNINWVFGVAGPQQFLPPVAYLVVIMLLMPVMVYLPTHWILLKCFGARAGGARLVTGAGG